MSLPTPPSEPRVAHYLYAHRALPRAFLQNPAAILGILASEDGMEFLTGMWDVLDKELDPEQRVDNSGLKLDHYELANGVYSAVVTLPPPQRSFEAFYVALVARLEGDESFSRAFSLDLAGPPGDNAGVGILEWSEEGEHELRETNRDRTIEGFLDRIEKIVSGEGDP